MSFLLIGAIIVAGMWVLTFGWAILVQLLQNGELYGGAVGEAATVASFVAAIAALFLVVAGLVGWGIFAVRGMS